jgi:hypothetical protein
MLDRIADSTLVKVVMPQLSSGPLGGTKENMMRRTTAISILLLSLLVHAQQKPAPTKVEHAKQSLLWLKTQANPDKDLLRSLAAGDTSFRGVQGYVVIIPGVDSSSRQFSDKYGVRVIPGTGDAYSTNAELELQSKAISYARKYNVALLKILAVNKIHK